jgi:hypothetical protein
MVTGKSKYRLSDTSATAEVSGFSMGRFGTERRAEGKHPFLVRGWTQSVPDFSGVVNPFFRPFFRRLRTPMWQNRRR